MFCKNCGQEISDNAYVCPHCGVKVSAAVPEKKKTNTLSIIGFVLAFLIPIAGLICSIIGKKQCVEQDEGGAGLALAGIIISIAEMCLAFIIVIAAVAAVAAL